ncbi:hypothetical protein HII36_05375 [Nonomuraea sp. NN258]|uniref:hypothetical protein n=1 Tax=Nonomuraea antri TaxID=2730852 RepID=UPI0015689477|nr:hypothetical protein [Nonomuraea antri]NRQ31268.1 hypothetical protein [Nonomuraea antri]
MVEVWQTWDVELAYTAADLLVPQAGIGQPVPHGGEPLWGIYQVAPATGAHGLRMLPNSELEWRCAEYGFDPDDVDTLIDVALHEPHLPARDDPLAWQSPALAALMEEIHGLPAWWTPGVPDAERSAAHLARIAAVKKHLVRVEDAPQAHRAAALAYVGSDRVAEPDPLAPMRTGVRLDPARVQARVLAVEWVRATSEKPQRPAFGLKPPGTFVGMHPAPGGAG